MPPKVLICRSRYLFRIGASLRPDAEHSLLAVLSDPRCTACVRTVSFSHDASVSACTAMQSLAWCAFSKATRVNNHLCCLLSHGQVLYCACDDATVWHYDIREINSPAGVAELES